MREALAERLLAEVMRWSPEDVARERPLLQALGTIKYDEYQQFSPGMKFVESLAIWLNQFVSHDEKQIAYEFVKKRLIFFSNSEINHFVSISYPDFIRPLLIQRTAQDLQISKVFQKKILSSTQFALLQRKCLFLGLSDGAHTDIFRRSNKALTHEQICQTYELSNERKVSLKNELRKDISKILGDSENPGHDKFNMVFLLDDFSGIGTSYLLKKGPCGKYSGKVHRFIEQIYSNNNGLEGLVSGDDLYLGIVLYIATEQSCIQLNTALSEILSGGNIQYGIHVVQKLNSDVCVDTTKDSEIITVADNYYDARVENEHTRKGGSDVIMGYASCSLPVVLSHNTPNNSIFLLWANPDDLTVRGLFPRVSRHKSEQ